MCFGALKSRLALLINPVHTCLSQLLLTHSSDCTVGEAQAPLISCLKHLWRGVAGRGYERLGSSLAQTQEPMPRGEPQKAGSAMWLLCTCSDNENK